MIHILLTLLFANPLWAAENGPVWRWEVAAKKLQTAGFEPEFIAALKTAVTAEGFADILELNTLLFLRKNDYHGVQVTPEAVESVRKFCDNNHEALEKTESNFAVPGEIVASLLWLESRHGQNQGSFSVATVFVDLLQADQIDNIHYLYHAAHKFSPKVGKKDRRDILQRTHKRVKWALSEFKALSEMWKRDPMVLGQLKGSFAGAFGIPQFEPSSYVHYAKSFSAQPIADLSRADDAIFSVAYYLKSNGWRRRSRSHLRSLMRYNDSHDYANAILKLARLAHKHETRKPSSGP